MTSEKNDEGILDYLTDQKNNIIYFFTAISLKYNGGPMQPPLVGWVPTAHTFKQRGAL